MLEILKKTVLTGIGLAALTGEKIEELARDLAKAGNLSEREGRELVTELLKKSEQARKDLEKQVDQMVARGLKKLDIPTRQEVSRLERKIAKLEKQLQELLK